MLTLTVGRSMKSGQVLLFNLNAHFASISKTLHSLLPAFFHHLLFVKCRTQIKKTCRTQGNPCSSVSRQGSNPPHTWQIEKRPQCTPRAAILSLEAIRHCGFIVGAHVLTHYSLICFHFVKQPGVKLYA